MADGLYDTDFYQWTRQQADLLRSRDAASNALDWERLAEEIEDMGKSEAHACESHISSVLLHFLKLHLVRDRQPERHWRVEIKSFRIALRRRLSPSLEARLVGQIASLYADALALFVLQFEPDQLIAPAPDDSPWSFEDVLGRGEDWLPETASIA
ncbi:MAG: DUF29 domain-containing protein [Alphaproteobacteria bacterium]|nr:DUF29 domain-containing protein [Alphaproteobacteria bacterium]